MNHHLGSLFTNVKWLKPVLGRTYKLEEAGQAQHDVIHTEGATGKLILSV